MVQGPGIYLPVLYKGRWKAMIGFLIGFLSGLAELYLLIKLTSGYAKKGTAYMAGIFFAKLGLFAGSAALVALVVRDSLMWYAAGITGVLIVGSIIIFCRQAIVGGKKDA